MSAKVLDASAILAFLFDEPGAEYVLASLEDRPLMSAVNLAEVLTKLSDQGVVPEEAGRRLQASGVLGAIVMVPFDDEQAQTVATLRHSTRPLGLSLADRACLALALRRGATALTADKAWLQVPGVAVEVIR